MYEKIKGKLLDFIAQFLLALVLNCCKLSFDDLKKKKSSVVRTMLQPCLSCGARSHCSYIFLFNFFFFNQPLPSFLYL